MTESVRHHLAMVAATIVLYLVALALNAWLFSHLEYVPGISWIYLPAGVRLVSTLLFAEAGAVGLLIGSLAVSFLFSYPDDPVRAFAAAVLPALASYGVYRCARHHYGFHHSLANLTPRRLLVLIVAYSTATPLLHHGWLLLRDDAEALDGLFAMVVGDLLGTLLVIYAMKIGLWLVPRRRA